MKCICKSHGTLEGCSGKVPKTKFAQVWPREMCQKICTGIQILIRQRRGQYLADIYYPIGGVPLGRRGRGRPRKKSEGIVSKEGVIYDCPARMRRVHQLHPAHARNGEPPLFCKFYQLEPSGWSCEACFGVRPHDDPDRTLVSGCRCADGGNEVVRRVKKQFGQQAGAGFVRDFAIPAVGVADGDPITDDIDLDAEVGGVISALGGGAISALQGSVSGGRRVVAKEEREEVLFPISQIT